MSAKAIFDRLQADQWAELERWKSDAEPEGVHLDFKQRSSSGPRLDDHELATVAKAASAFANVEGGVLVLGIVARAASKGELDRVQSLAPFPDVEKVAGHLDGRVGNLTDPPIAGVQVVSIPEPSNASSGVVAMYVPSSDGGPHQAAVGSALGRYFIRTATTSAPAPHSILAALFGRRPQPRLRLAVRHWPTDRVAVFVQNHGRGLGEDIHVRLHLRDPRDPSVNLLADGVSIPGFSEQKPGGDYVQARPYEMALTLRGVILFPGDAVRVLNFRQAGRMERLQVVARLDARDAMPTMSDALVSFDGDNPITVPALEDQAS